MRKLCSFLLMAMMLCVAPSLQAATATFDDNALAPETNWGGAGSGEAGFVSGDTYFIHNDGGWSWDGFVYSNRTDTTTAGYTNQFSAVTGSGLSGSTNYGVGYIPLDWTGGTYDPIPQIVSFGASTGEDYNTTISGMYITNTTYAYLSMRDGDGFAKQFGGTSGDDEDWFKMTVTGITETGYTANAVDFYLADFRYSDNSMDYIIDDWTWVNLEILGDVVGLEFTLASSDGSIYGMNTPGYFAIDDFNGTAPVPLPAAFWLLGTGLIACVGIRRRDIN
ncbi:MAG: DUF4465 domain-containing protein [Pseudomonadota bacterium]